MAEKEIDSAAKQQALEEARALLRDEPRAKNKSAYFEDEVWYCASCEHSWLLLDAGSDTFLDICCKGARWAMMIKDACIVQAEMSEDGGHSDEGESDDQDDEQDGILVRPPCKLLLQAKLMRVCSQ